MSVKKSIVPSFRYPVPSLDHVKAAPYIDFPLIYNETVADRAFYVEGEFIWVCSDPNAVISKWNGNSFTAVTSYTNPDIIEGRGFFAVTTVIDAYCSISELDRPSNSYKSQL